MTAIVMRGDARGLPLPDESVDLIVTSPPYFGLRDYRDGDASLAGQIGAEATPREYVAALLECTREWMRVLKPEGSLFVNLGDSYYSGKGAPGKTSTDPKNAGRNARRTTRSPLDYGLDLPRKTLIGLPWRYALGCMDELGLTLRAEIIWDKPNGLPESVTDRVRRSHEQLFHLVKQARYYSAVDEIRDTYSERTHDRQRYAGHDEGSSRTRGGRDGGNIAHGILGLGHKGMSPLGKLPGSVWEIASQPLAAPAHLGVDHFAAFPMELPRRCIAGWSPPAICTACGEGRRPRTLREIGPDAQGRRGTQHGGDRGHLGHATERKMLDGLSVRTITGYDCGCPGDSAPTWPSVVLDPFGGTGTTALVADVLGRTGISVDRSADYCRLARWRTTDPGERARAMQVPKPPPVPDGQGDLFSLEAS